MSNKLLIRIAQIAQHESLERASVLLSQLQNLMTDEEASVNELKFVIESLKGHSQRAIRHVELTDATPPALQTVYRACMTIEMPDTPRIACSPLYQGMIKQLVPHATLFPLTTLSTRPWVHWEWREDKPQWSTGLQCTVGPMDIPLYVLHFFNTYSLKDDLPKLFAKPTAIPLSSNLKSQEIVCYPKLAEFTVLDIRMLCGVDKSQLAERMCFVLDALLQGVTLVLTNVEVVHHDWLLKTVYPHFDQTQFILLSTQETKQELWKTPAFLNPLKRPLAAKMSNPRVFLQAIEKVLIESFRGFTSACNIATQWETKKIELWNQHFELLIPVVHESVKEQQQQLCVVSGLFAIRARETSATQPAAPKSVKSIDQYVQLGQQFLDWNVKMLLFTEPELVKTLFDERKRRGLARFTLVYPVCLELTRFYPAFPTLRQRYLENKIPAGYCPHKDTPLYVMAQANKLDYMDRSMRLGAAFWPQVSHYFWVDFGIYHVARPPDCGVGALLDQLARVQRIRLALSRPLQRAEIENRAVYYSRLQQVTAGGLFGGPTEAMKWFVQAFENEFVKALDHFPALEEALFGVIWLSHPEKFVAWSASHQTLLQPRLISNVLSSMADAAKAGDWSMVWDLGCELPDGDWVDMRDVYRPYEWYQRADWLLQCFQHLPNLLKTAPNNKRRSSIRVLVQILEAHKSLWPKDEQKRLLALCKVT